MFRERQALVLAATLLLCIFPKLALCDVQKIKTGIFLMGLNKINYSEGSYFVDFYMTLKSDKPFTDNFELMNCQSSSKELADNTPTYKVYRIKATCTESVSYRRYPLDTHRLTIQIEDKLLDDTAMQIVPDDSLGGIDTKVTVLGWNIEPKYFQNTSGHHYPNFKQTYSRFSYGVTLRKAIMSSVIKGVLPCLIIGGVALLLYFMNPKEPKDRVMATSSLLIANVVIHLNSTSALPPLGYLTVQDKLVLSNYALIFVSLAVIMLLIKLSTKHHDKLPSVNRAAFWVVFPSYVLLQMINILE